MPRLQMGEGMLRFTLVLRQVEMHAPKVRVAFRLLRKPCRSAVDDLQKAVTVKSVWDLRSLPPKSLLPQSSLIPSFRHSHG